MITMAIDLKEYDAYVVEPNGWFRICKIDRCENCNTKIEAANSISIQPRGGELTLRINGMQKLEKRLPEGYYSDKIEGEACEVCNA